MQNINTKDIIEAGLVFGHKKSQIHPKMKDYVVKEKNGVHLIDPEKIKEKLEEALNVVSNLIKEQKTILLVGTKVQIKALVKKTAEECNLPYVNERWLGGTLTNFETIKKRVDYFKDLEQKKEAGELEKYTKKERLKINRELLKLKTKFEGIKNLEKLPDAILVFDIKKDITAVREAKNKKVLIIGISDTNTDPTIVDYPIVANDDAIPSIKYILERLKEVVLQSQKETK